MIKTIDFNSLAAGTIVDNEFQADGVTVSAIGGSGDAMIFDTANPTGGDSDLATSNLGGVLIVSEDGDSGDPDDNAGGGCLVFDFTNDVRVKQLTFLDIEEAARMVFYDADGNEIANKYVSPTDDGGQKTVQIDIEGVARLEVVLNGSGAVDNLVFDDGLPVDPEGDGIVSGSNDDDVIDLAYEGDPEGDMIDAGDALLPGEAPDDDIVDALGGNDDISAEEGDDDVYAGSGDDTVDGGAGDDIIYGDSNYEDGTGGGDPVRESLEWDLVGVPNDGDMGNFTQDTGNTNVSFNILSETPNVITSYETDAQLVDGIEADGDPVNANSSFYSETCGEGQSASYELSFDNPVGNVDFRINDIDGDGVVRVLAYDADGNQITVNLTGGSCITLLDTDSVAGADTADSQGGYDDDTSATYSVLVDIPGPVARIVIEHSQDGPNNSGINVTDIYFDADDGAVIDDGPDGNDDLFGGAGDDMIFGEGGDDTLTGGEGSDTLSGGDDRDTFVGGDGGDAVDGGTGGNDVDTLDLRDSGPLRIVGETVDADGDSTSGTVEFLDGDGNVTSSMTFAEIERLLLPENSAPTARDDSAVTDEDTPVTIPVLANDSDPDADPLTVTSATSPDGDVVINADGTLEFTPSENFNGETTITYTIDDGNGGTDTAEVTVTVNPVNDAPVANDDSASTDEDTAVVIPVLDNDTDVDGDALTVVSATSPDGDVVINDDGTLSFAPAPDFNGETTITYTIDDGNGGTDTADVTVTVGGVNDAPVANDDSAVTDEDTPVTIPVLANDSDPDGDPLTVTSATSPDGDVIINDDGTLEFTPSENFNGETTITYTVDDGNGGTDTAEVTVTVNPVNDAPVATDDVAMTILGEPVTIPVLANDSDPDGDPLTVTEATSPDGDVVINGDGTITFTPADGFGGDAEISYTVSDGNGGTDTATVAVTVRDGIVSGTDDGDLIDGDYDGDPDGDFVDNDDAILPGEEGDDDIIEAGGGDDTVNAGAGNDEVFGGDGNDILNGEEGDDALFGEDGDDTLTGGAGSDTLDGGAGDDRLEGNDGDDLIDGMGGDDDIIGGLGNDTIFGRGGSDTVEGNDGDDVIDTSNGDILPDLGYPFADTDPLGYLADPDPENDRDLVDGGGGDDTIRTGDDSDTITGGAGNDVIDAGIDDDIVEGNDGDDRIVGGEGNDSILGGDGADTIYAGNDPDLGLDILDIPDVATDDNPFSPDRNPDNGRDTVDGGAGDDVIYGADDDDVLLGGSGNDFLDGQIDDDTLSGGTGLDTLVGGQGDDSLSGGLGNDELDGGIGDDTLRGNRDDDLLDGGDGNDLLDGGGQNDTLNGGDGDDTLQGATGDDALNGGDGDDDMDGGAGNDIFDGGAGNDDMRGGGDRDTFINVNAGDVVNGNEAGDDFDCLDLTGSAPVGGRLEVEYADDNPENGTVFYFDADNNPAGQLVFSNIEKVVPCFTPGTKIATPKGEVAVEDLQVGDRVITRDNGIQEIRWVGHKEMTGDALVANQHMRPVLIRAGALGNNLPERDMMVSPNHRVLVANDKTALYFEEREVLVAAKHLTALDGIDIVDVSGTTYIHVMFDCHEVILSDGTWTESFQPGDNSLAGVGDAQRAEILELFPELATREGVDGYSAARRSLKKHEAKLLTK